MTRSAKCVLTLVTAVAGAVLSLRRRRTAAPSTDPVPAPTESVAAVEVVTPADAEENGAPIADEIVLGAVELATPVDPEENGSHVAMPAATGTAASQILELLATSSPMSAIEVAEATGIGRATVRSALSRLTRAGRLVKVEKGYELAGAAPSPAPSARPPRASATARPQTTKDRVLSALSSEVGLTAGEVAAATGIARGTVSTTLSNLVRAGEIVKAPRGYRLPA